MTRFQTSPFPPRFRINTTPSHTHTHTHTRAHTRTHTRTHSRTHSHAPTLTLSLPNTQQLTLCLSHKQTLSCLSQSVSLHHSQKTCSVQELYTVSLQEPSPSMYLSLFDTHTHAHSHTLTHTSSLTHASNSKFSWKMIILLRPLSIPQKINRLPDNKVPLFGKKCFETF